MIDQQLQLAKSFLAGARGPSSCQQRLHWHLHEHDSAPGWRWRALDRAIRLDRLGGELARREQTTPATTLPVALRPEGFEGP